MATAIQQKSGFEKWQDGLSNASSDAKWNSHDCDIRAAVNEYNYHLMKTNGYFSLDWQLIKAMVWVESGAESPEWKTKPMQIGVPGDPGLSSFLSGKEGGDLIIPPSYKNYFSRSAVAVNPIRNIRAGIGYVLIRMARTDYATILDSDSKTYDVVVKSGDSLDRIAKEKGTTVDLLRRLNRDTTLLRPGQKLMYQKASVQRVITGWRSITTSTIAQRYNGGGDPNYEKKLDYALMLIKQRKVAECTQ